MEQALSVWAEYVALIVEPIAIGVCRLRARWKPLSGRSSPSSTDRLTELLRQLGKLSVFSLPSQRSAHFSTSFGQELRKSTVVVRPRKDRSLGGR
jgi:hypothetical protein